MCVLRCTVWVDSGFVNISRYKNFNNKSIIFFPNSKIGEEQSAEDAEDGPPELLVYVGFIMQDEMYVQDGFCRSMYMENELELQILALDFKLAGLESYCDWGLIFIENKK